MESVRQAVFEVIGLHQDIPAFMQEVGRKETSTESAGQKTGPDKATVESLYNVIMGQAAAANSCIPEMVASLCAQRLEKVLVSVTTGALLLTKYQKAQCTVLIGVIKNLKAEDNFSRHTFTKAINKNDSLPIELVWLLHKEDIMPYDSYITCNLQHPGVIKGFVQALCSLSFPQPNDVTENNTQDTLKLRKSIITDILSELVEQAYTERTKENTATKGLKKVSSALLDSLTKKLLSQKSEPPDICIFEVLLSACLPLDRQFLKRYACRQIGIILSHNPILKVSDALVQQSRWTYARTPQHLRHMYTQLLLVLEAGEVLSLVESLLVQQEVNWQTVLPFITTFLVSFPQAPALLRDLVASLLSKAILNCDMDSLVLAFLLARQGALEDTGVFMSYKEWFQKAFCESSTTPANNKKTVGFLLKFLTDIVPFESASVLKVHILCPPAVPAKCRPLLADYILLAKTRLQDLKEPLDQFTMSDTSRSKEAEDKMMLQAEQDVEKAMSSYEKTGRVPASVMEASIFRKPYFIGKFLTALLKGRPLPDIPDVRMKFIDVLHRADKIPSSMFNNYEKACQQEAVQLLEGFLSDDDDTMETLLLPPGEQLEHSLTQLAEAVIEQHQENRPRTGVAGLISIISEKIHNMLSTEPSVSYQQESPVLVNIHTPSGTPLLAKVVEMVVQTVCQIQAGLSSFPAHQGAWLTQLLQMLTRHDKLWKAVLYQLWMLLTCHGPDLHPCHTNGLAAIVVNLFSTPLGAVQVKTSSHECSYNDGLLNNLRTHDQRWMEFGLRFYTAYIQHAVTAYSNILIRSEGKDDTVVPPAVVKKFQFLVTRLCPGARSHPSTSSEEVEEDCSHQVSLSLSVYRSKTFEKLKAMSGLTFSEWAELEMDVVPGCDGLSDWQRDDYHEWVMAEQGSVDEEVRLTSHCITLTNTILDHDIRFHEFVRKSSSCSCPRRSLHHGHQSGRSHLLHLLRHLVTLMPSPTTSTRGRDDMTTEIPWLGEVWQQRLSRVDGEDEYNISRHVEHVAFLRLSRTLFPQFYKRR